MMYLPIYQRQMQMRRQKYLKSQGHKESDTSDSNASSSDSGGCKLSKRDFELKAGRQGCNADKITLAGCKKDCCKMQAKWCKEQNGDPSKCIKERGCSSNSNFIQIKNLLFYNFDTIKKSLSKKQQHIPYVAY